MHRAVLAGSGLFYIALAAGNRTHNDLHEHDRNGSGNPLHGCFASLVLQASSSYHRHLASEIGRKDRLRDKSMNAAHNVDDLRHAEADGDAAQCIGV